MKKNKDMKMKRIKRVLWIDDYPDNKASSLFPEEETCKVSSMDDAIREIAGDSLYDYDTIVLDIDFENGLISEKEVISRLSQKIYLSKDQRTKQFVINNGGYLLYLFLLEKGYPSDQVAFLTGNGGIIAQLQEYTRQNEEEYSKEDIFDLYCSIWNEIHENPELLDGYSGDDLDMFQDRIDALAIHESYKDSETVMDCAERLDCDDFSGAREIIEDVEVPLVTGNINNTGDMMIFRFHEANLEAPVYFSKNENDIFGHNISDMTAWLEENRTGDRLTRWLLLEAGNYVEALFTENPILMNNQTGCIFHGVEDDPGIRSSFRQMYFVFDGMRNLERRGPYYQAIAAMLIPFDNSPHGSEPAASAKELNYNNVQKMFARFSKQARNYCAHNSFGSTLSNESVIFILMGTLASVLNKNQRSDFDSWYKNAKGIFKISDHVCDGTGISKVKGLYETLKEKGYIDFESAHVYRDTDFSSLSAWDLVRALGYNKMMTVASEKSTSKREDYYIFTLAAYILKWFGGYSVDEIRQYIGDGIARIYETADYIVKSYEYPN